MYFPGSVPGQALQFLVVNCLGLKQKGGYVWDFDLVLPLTCICVHKVIFIQIGVVSFEI